MQKMQHDGDMDALCNGTFFGGDHLRLRKLAMELILKRFPDWTIVDEEPSFDGMEHVINITNGLERRRVAAQYSETKDDILVAAWY